MTINVSVKSDVYVNAFVSALVEKNFERPEAGLRLWDTMSVIPAAAPVRLGYPTVAPLWCRTTPMFSLSGEHIIASRPEPYELDLGATATWLPYGSSWDGTTGTWTPWVDTDLGFSWVQPNIMLRPTLSERTYSLGREFVTVPQMRFDGGQHLLSSFFIGAMAVNYTISLVAWLNQPASNHYPLLDWGTPTMNLDPVPPLPEYRTYMHVGDKLYYGWQGYSGDVDTPGNVHDFDPVFITMSVSAPSVTCYVGCGPKKSYHTTINGKAGTGLGGMPLNFALGGAANQVEDLQDSDFSLLGMALWDRPLTATEVTELHATYASVWGVSGAWS